jgi:alpha-L-fucosidase
MNPAKEYRWGSTQWADGSQVQSPGELADNFDADDLAKTAASMGAQYVIFTTWHANMNVLYPSEVMKKWLPDTGKTYQDYTLMEVCPRR